MGQELVESERGKPTVGGQESTWQNRKGKKIFKKKNIVRKGYECPVES